MGRPKLDYRLEVSEVDETGRIIIKSPDNDLLGLYIYAEPAAAFEDVARSVAMLRELDRAANSTSEGDA